MVPDRGFVAERFYRWLKGFPEPSIKRLTRINNASADARHVILSLSFAVYDCRIRALNNLIVKLLVARLRAERISDNRSLERIQAILTGLHVAIDWATGKLELSDHSHLEQPSCNKVSKPLSSS
ncbi:MAG: hypothetical protein K2X93_14000 [Candidatus Obscuribacterales bacterium]|nr:hypothetical protein [Candidatus Obscuribacterales bacterium]